MIAHSDNHVVEKMYLWFIPYRMYTTYSRAILETEIFYHKKNKCHVDAPEASLAVIELVTAACEYCNLYGLWIVKA